MIVADLAPPALEGLLRQGSLRVRTGPLVVAIESPLREIRDGIALNYAQHALEPSDGFADFHVCVDRPRVLYRWLDKRVRFRFDGIEPFAPLPGDQSLTALESGLNWCIAKHCHQYLILHAAALERGGRALLLPAPSGSGKSTLCAGLAFGGGWRLLSDDLALVDPANGQVLPLPRPVRLQNKSIDAMRAFAPAVVFGERVRETTLGEVSYARPPADAVLRADEQALPAWLVIPRFTAGAATQLRPLSRARAFMALVENSFNYNVHGRAGFAALADVIDRSACYEFTYSNLLDASAALEELANTTP